jgi:hypothetical protein
MFREEITLSFFHLYQTNGMEKTSMRSPALVPNDSRRQAFSLRQIYSYDRLRFVFSWPRIAERVRVSNLPLIFVQESKLYTFSSPLVNPIGRKKNGVWISKSKPRFSYLLTSGCWTRPAGFFANRRKIQARPWPAGESTRPTAERSLR